MYVSGINMAKVVAKTQFKFIVLKLLLEETRESLQGFSSKFPARCLIQTKYPLDDVLHLEIISGFLVIANQRTVHNWGVSDR